MKNPKRALANLDTMRKVFSVPEGQDSTLARIEREISENLSGFLRDHIVAGDLLPAEIEGAFSDVRIPEDPLFVSEQAEYLLTKVVAQSVHTSSPSFIGHMTSAMPYFMLPLAKIMTALNQNLVKIETSKASTPLERQVISMLHNLIYERDENFYAKYAQARATAVGAFCSGGTIANITGLWVARNRMLSAQGTFRGVAEDGLAAGMEEHGFRSMAIVVSQRGHYSLEKAADILGIGRRGLSRIPTAAQQKIDLRALRAELERCAEKRIGVIALVGIAGTTETGNVDPLAALGELAREFHCHFHIDAAWGGPTLFSHKYRDLLNGISSADSVTIDAHKQLYVPVGAGIVLFKEPSALNAIETHANYIIRTGSRDIGRHTLEGSRPGMAMLVHSALRVIGRAGYELLIDHGIGKARQFARMIDATDDFELITEPELNLLTYRYVPPHLHSRVGSAEEGGHHGGDARFEERLKMLPQMNALTIEIQKRQRQRGRTFVSRTMLETQRYGRGEVVVFRAILANPLTTRIVLEEIIAEQRSIAGDCLQEPEFAELRPPTEGAS